MAISTNQILTGWGIVERRPSFYPHILQLLQIQNPMTKVTNMTTFIIELDSVRSSLPYATSKCIEQDIFPSEHFYIQATRGNRMVASYLFY